MITTDFEPFCNDCPDLEPVVTRLYAGECVLQQVITCENIHRCRKIVEFYQKKGEANNAET